MREGAVAAAASAGSRTFASAISGDMTTAKAAGSKSGGS